MTSTGKGLEIRFEAGEILGALGDPRIKDYPMVNVEAGEFVMGSDKYKWERPIHKVYLDEFMIGKYPVTNQEFNEFINDEGYKNKELWYPEGWIWREKESILEPLHWHDRKWNGSNFPVVGVSWYEAVAFTKWLSNKTGEIHVLPTEAQWEKSARGTDGREYPWGNEFIQNYCHSFACDLHRTSPVGIFPADKSPYSCFDMAGNVVEWCMDWYIDDYYKKSPIKNPQGPLNSSTRVVRGGSYGRKAHECRAAYRNSYSPSFRGRDVGFRLVRLF
jgi:formylglycine-generating enzyme required for sulfatase activity